MRSFKLMVVALLIVGWVATGTALAQVTADDFLPVAQGGATKVKQPEKVVVKNKVVTAATAQDAVNAAVLENKKALKESNTPEVGAKMVKFPSGLGYVATGVATYRAMENPVATRIAKRKAYRIAFLQAQKNLAEIYDGTTDEGMDAFRENVLNVNREKAEGTGVATQSDEAIKQTLEKMLKGFVVYEVKDDTDQHLVYVSIATTPKTQGKAARPAPTVVDAQTLRDGLNQVIADIRSGITLPVGGRTVTMHSTGETAFVGFGSCVVRSSANTALQAKLNLTAQKIASMRARDALCAIIGGDKVSGQRIAAEQQSEDIRDFASPELADAAMPGNLTDEKKLDQTRNSFLAKLGFEETVESVRKGKLPPGIIVKTWFDEDHAWAYGMAVYVPSLTNAAAKAAREMDESEIVQPIDDGSGKPSDAPSKRGTAPPAEKPSSGFTDEDNPKVPRPGKEVKPGPSGKIDPE